MNTPERQRVFFAFGLNEALQDKLDQTSSHLQKAARERRIKASWSRRAQRHLTLRFLGETTPTERQLLIETASSVLEDISPLEVQVEGVGFFGTPEKPRVLWAGVKDPTGSLQQLFEDFESALNLAGFSRETFEQYRPHITLCRLRSTPLDSAQQLLKPHADRMFGPLSLRELTLYQSQLTSEGMRYLPLRQFPLMDSPPQSAD